MSDPVTIAQSFLGTPYKYGGTDCGGIDCSALVQKAYPALPRTAREQYLSTEHIRASDLRRGDLVFLQGTQASVPGGAASHVGIYNGDGTVTEAPHTGAAVRQSPLSGFIKRGLLGYGRVGGVPKSKSGPRGAVTQVTPPQATQMPAGSPTDLSAYLQGILDSRPQQDPLNLYDPFSPTSAPNPGYNPQQTDSLAGTFGNGSGLDLSRAFGPRAAPRGAPYAPFDERQTIQRPSIYDQYTQTAAKAQSQMPNPLADKAAEIASHGKILTELAKLQEANPAAQLSLPDYMPIVPREQDAIPTRPAPQLDPLSASLAALAGLFDPRHAGQFGSAPLQAGLGVAQQQYDDSQKFYQQKQQQLSQRYEDELAARNDRAHYDLTKAGTDYQNADAKRQAALLSGQNRISGAGDLSLADVLSGIGNQQKEAGASGLQANLLNDQIGRQLAQNTAQINNAKTGQKQENDLLKNLMTVTQRGYSADQRAQSAADRTEMLGNLQGMKNDLAIQLQGSNADLKREIEKMRQKGQNDRNHENNQTKRDLAGLTGKINGLNLGRLPEVERIRLQGLKTVWTQAMARISITRDQALRAYPTATDAQGLTPAEYADRMGGPDMDAARTAGQALTDAYNQLRQPATGGGATRPTAPARPALSPRVTGSGMPIIGPDGKPYNPGK